jgi:hypothetical protein
VGLRQADLKLLADNALKAESSSGVSAGWSQSHPTEQVVCDGSWHMHTFTVGQYGVRLHGESAFRRRPVGDDHPRSGARPRMPRGRLQSRPDAMLSDRWLRMNEPQADFYVAQTRTVSLQSRGRASETGDFPVSRDDLSRSPEMGDRAARASAHGSMPLCAV